MITSLITDVGGIAAIEEGWLALTALRGNAFTSPGWVRAWGASTTQQLTIAAVHRDDGSLAGVMPMAIGRGGRGALRFAGAALGDRFGPVCAPEDAGDVAAAAVEAIEGAGRRPMMTILHRVDADADWPARMAAASSRRMLSIVQSPAELLSVPVGDDGWEGYLATRSSKFRQRVVRGLEKSLSKDHSYEIRETADAAQLEADLATLFRLHDLRHAQDSSIASEGDRRVLAAFAREALALGWLRLRFLEVEGKAVAAFLGWRIGPTYGIYQSGFDPAWADYSVGMLLLVATLRAGFDEQAREIDMLLGGEDYKQRLATARREVHTVTHVPAVSVARVLVGAEAAARRHARTLASRPVVGTALKRAARLLPTGRRE